MRAAPALVRGKSWRSCCVLAVVPPGPPATDPKADPGALAERTTIARDYLRERRFYSLWDALQGSRGISWAYRRERLMLWPRMANGLQMKSHVCWLLWAFVAMAAQAQEPVLPQDFPVSTLGRLGDTTEIKELSSNSFEIRQRFPRTAENGEELNFITFCVASRIAAQRNFNGWSLSMRSSDHPQATSRVLTLVLLNSESDAKELPTTSHWLPYMTIRQFRPTCSHLVNPRYLWAEGPSTPGRNAAPLSQEVGAGESAFPMVNPHPTHQLTLTGALPARQPIDDVKLVYGTTMNTGNNQCQRSDPLPPIPLIHTVILPLIRGDASYRATLFVDQYLPGPCHWGLSQIVFRLHVAGFAIPMEIQHRVVAVDEQKSAPLAANLRTRQDHGCPCCLT